MNRSTGGAGDQGGAPRQREASHVGHANIRDYQVDSRVTAEQREGLNAIACLNDPVSLLHKAPNDHLPHLVLIFDDENGG
jgi:hypothetical protein